MTRSNQTNMCSNVLRRLIKLMVMLQSIIILQAPLATACSGDLKRQRQKWIGTRVRVVLSRNWDWKNSTVQVAPYDFDNETNAYFGSGGFHFKVGVVVAVNAPNEDKRGYVTQKNKFVILLDSQKGDKLTPVIIKNAIVRITAKGPKRHRGKLAVAQNYVGDEMFQNPRVVLKLFDEYDTTEPVSLSHVENAIIAVKRGQMKLLYRVGDKGVDANGNTVEITGYKGEFEIKRKEIKIKQKKKGALSCLAALCGGGTQEISKFEIESWGISEGFKKLETDVAGADPLRDDVGLVKEETWPYEITITPPDSKDEPPKELKTRDDLDGMFIRHENGFRVTESSSGQSGVGTTIRRLLEGASRKIEPKRSSRNRSGIRSLP